MRFPADNTSTFRRLQLLEHLFEDCLVYLVMSFQIPSGWIIVLDIDAKGCKQDPILVVEIELSCGYNVQMTQDRRPPMPEPPFPHNRSIFIDSRSSKVWKCSLDCASRYRLLGTLFRIFFSSHAPAARVISHRADSSAFTYVINDIKTIRCIRVKPREAPPVIQNSVRFYRL